MTQASAFRAAMLGRFTSTLRWPDLDALFEVMARDSDKAWYVYVVGQPPPAQTVSPAQLAPFLRDLSAYLRREHDESYCGIVYADDLADPHLVKIYDPDNLGSSCGSSGLPTLPGWVLSTLAPEELTRTGAWRWWRRLLGSG